MLVQFGGRTVEDCAWNSCVFDLAVNNGFRPSRAPSMASSPPSPGTAAAPANAPTGARSTIWLLIASATVSSPRCVAATP